TRHWMEARRWAQAGRSIPVFGTTHADHFNGPVPISRQLTRAEIDGQYEVETGRVIIETIESTRLDPLSMPAVLVASHGPFTWGPSAGAAVEIAIALEAVAAMATRTVALDPGARPIADALLERHHRRKHGADAYYGQVRRGPGAARRSSTSPGCMHRGTCGSTANLPCARGEERFVC